MELLSRVGFFCTWLFQIEIEHGFQLMFILIIRQYSTYDVFFWRSTEANFIMYRLFGVSHKRNAAQIIKVKFSFLSSYPQSPSNLKANICNAKLYRTQVTGLNGIQLPALSVIYADMAGLSLQPGWHMCGCVCVRARKRMTDPSTHSQYVRELNRWHDIFRWIFCLYFIFSVLRPRNSIEKYLFVFFDVITNRNRENTKWRKNTKRFFCCRNNEKIKCNPMKWNTHMQTDAHTHTFPTYPIEIDLWTVVHNGNIWITKERHQSWENFSQLNGLAYTFYLSGTKKFVFCSELYFFLSKLCPLTRK